MNHDCDLPPTPSPKKQIAVDLDGTLAEYHGWKGNEHIGEPVVPMLDRVKRWVKAGKSVVIYTARACDPKAVFPIQEWLLKNGLPTLEITNIKRKEFVEFWDDRAIGVVPNKGITDVEHYANTQVLGKSDDSAFNSQVGGDHYSRMKIQPVEFCHANGMGGIESAVVKYVSRHRFKNGAEDINKAIHLLELLKELEYKK